ncbi:chaetoglobosin A biosynthesis cluster protein C-like [Maniola jurtina]|uniref:chaetoglobosin A biosynthesis cluster protein C-like n=1 Tax=Maniola jurtina TaxID=191418 RepID=UPI001E689BEA|nr:chaetoglobosin A biosynthesis cluster protein C-like [Maniola jurtina]
MPRRYKRKEGVRPRIVSWTTEALQNAFDEMDKNIMGINKISRQFGIPSRTLRRRYAAKNKTKLTLGKHPIFGFENEKRLVKHILKLGEAGFPPDRRSIRMLAYQFAEKLKLKHKFDHESQRAGNEWCKSFIERNPELAIRQAEGLSVARAKGLSREEVNNFYELLAKVMIDNGLSDKPERIFNMDESGIQLNNKPGKVIAKKGAKVVNSVTSAEKGETMTIIACCNAIGNFLPPAVIIKGVNKKTEFEDGLPPGSKVYMNKKSAYRY